MFMPTMGVASKLHGEPSYSAALAGGARAAARGAPTPLWTRGRASREPLSTAAIRHSMLPLTVPDLSLEESTFARRR